MVTRVDKKPIIYNTCMIRCLKPAVVSSRKALLDKILSVSVGHKVPDITAREVMDDYDDIEHAFKMFGIDDPAYKMFSYCDTPEDDECIRIARMCLDKGKDMRKLLRSAGLMDEITRIQAKLFEGVERCYFGTEAVYQVFNRALWGGVFCKQDVPNYKSWCIETAQKILLTQSTYCLIHPIAIRDMAADMAKDYNYNVWYAWDMFKKLETIAIRLGSRKSMLAHAYYAGMNRRGFSPSKVPLEDFQLPLTGYAACQAHVSLHIIMGLRYYRIGDVMHVLTHDDCINLATMAQCYFRTAVYFTKSNGYDGAVMNKALALVKDIANHACKLMDCGKNFSHIIRSMHIMSQGEFNDAFEEECGSDLGWRDRSANYVAEARALDPMGVVFHKRATDLAVDKIDKLNTCFIYHVFIGDEMLLTDLRSKVANMTAKVLPADAKEWSNFIRFVKAYTLARFMFVYKKKPRVTGDIGLLNEAWAERCVSGNFTMPPAKDWGKVAIYGELNYTNFADTWHLEAQDVAYVVKDSDGIKNSKYVGKPEMHSELLMAMTKGNILDVLSGSTPLSARERISSGGEVKEVVITCAPKAENAKPSWKKRVTFAADCEFRKMQAEVDKNCRKIMGFIRGPSLAVDQCILEKQFSEIADATATGLKGAICSHDISAWSESMDRDRKFEFEEVLISMFDKPSMINIKNDWAKIAAVVTKQGAKDVVKIDNASFQGFDGTTSTLLHSFILIYCIDTARRAGIITAEVKANMATLIDDCIALMVDLFREQDAKNFWAHLKSTYLKLGFEVDDLKSIFSTIKAIYLSRRFIIGGEVPSDFKVFVKAHSSYEDPLRCSLDVPNDIFGAMRGACDANGESWYIYFVACVSSLAEIAHNHNFVMTIPPAGAAIFALAPVVENGWGFPSIVSWATNDITDKRAHFNAILELLTFHSLQSEDFKFGVDVYPKSAAKAVMAIKSQAWRFVSYHNIFTNPFEALREGPLKPDMLKRNAVQDLLKGVATAQPWVSLLGWHSSETTTKVRELLISSGPLHGPTLAALVNCMPDNYRLSLIGKAVGSDSLLGILPAGQRLVLKRRVGKCAQAYFMYSKAMYDSVNQEFLAEDFAALTYVERTRMEREEFYTANGCNITDHTFPDPVASFTVVGAPTGSLISPNLSSLRIWDKTKTEANRTNHFLCDKGTYVPRRSGRVWEVTCEFARGWDTVSQRIAMGLAILARAQADGHSTEGLLIYFVKAWNELSNITPKDTHLIAIHGSIKRLDANPGSSTHPIICNRNILRGFNNRFKSALDAIPAECGKITGSSANLHDPLAHETAMTCVTALMFSTFQYLGKLNYTLQYNIAVRPACIVPESELRMKTGSVADMINIAIMDGADNYGLLQACPSLAVEVAIPTMKSSWVRTINALIDRDLTAVESLRKDVAACTLDDIVAQLAEDEVFYSPSILLAAEPTTRSSYRPSDNSRLALLPTPESARAVGDSYTMSVRTVGSKFSRALSEHHPDHIIAATAVRSLVWSRLKDVSAQVLAKILYEDPDASTDCIKRCSTKDFWRGAIIEIQRAKRDKSLSEMTMAAFRSLGISELHVRHSEDANEVSQSVASYFGSHLSGVTIIISDLITSLAGRKSGDFSKPFIERIITNNPAVMNARMRKSHLVKLIESTVEGYKERIVKLGGDPERITHRGDKRCSDKHSRVVDLRCRVYTYNAIEIAESGDAAVNGMKFASTIAKCAMSVADRVKIDHTLLPAEATTFEGALEYMAACQPILNSGEGNSGWDAMAGSLGARLAYTQIEMDINLTMSTKFAVSAAEVAPKIHKRIIKTALEVPKIAPAEPAFPICGDSDDDDDDLLAMDDAQADAAMVSGQKTLPIPLWQALYALVVTGQIPPGDVDNKLGTSIGATISTQGVREAHLEDFSDTDILAAFPSLVAEYVASGTAFDPEWLNRDEADAYTTDEMHTIRGGFLM